MQDIITLEVPSVVSENGFSLDELGLRLERRKCCQDGPDNHQAFYICRRVGMILETQAPDSRKCDTCTKMHNRN